jgi:predicted NodU family carbamoyl transferase
VNITYAWARGLQNDLAEKYLTLGARYAGDEQALKLQKKGSNGRLIAMKPKRKKFDSWVVKNIDQSKQRVFDFYHHESHDASAAFYSPFDEGFVNTSDDRGDFEAKTIYKFQAIQMIN